MQVSARVHYGCLAMLELAVRHDQERPVTLREIVSQHQIPQPFLVQILQTLKAAGFVTSTRGSQGGYRLAVEPERVTLMDIAEAIGCGESASPAADANDQSSELAALRGVWSKADEAAREILAQTRLIDLVRQCTESPETMFYI
ncbi:RrF2 family transcriptional regulator [Candidatus Laterigemmans baculatus]|uniref:RrF2 family transcriptional regulator n=1 Tax=Candidatus Laterigemmans baculatus TaxID=2770505 RepID=UPI0013DBC244|nr:Rrf2 family transcriptional regulator [Candidatus Laterigemmans baculatus]